MGHILLPVKESEQRITAFQNALQQHHLDGAIVVGTTNMYYLSGTMQSGALYVPAAGPAILMVRRSLERAQIESPMQNIVPFSSYRAFHDILQQFGLPTPATIGVEYSMPMDAFGRMEKYVKGTFKDIQGLLAKCRSRKTAYEIDLLFEAGRRHVENFSRIPSLFRGNMTELELGAAIEYQMLLLGHHGMSNIQTWGNRLHIGYVSAGDSGYYPHMFDGPGGCKGICPAVPELGSQRPINKDEPVLIDLAFGYQGYHVDMTRIFCRGKLPQEALDAQKRCIEVQQWVVEKLKPGNVPSQIYQDIMERLKALNWDEHFMGYGDRAVKFLGHGVGLAVDEYPAIAKGFDEPLEAGMTLAVEPKKVIPGLGVVGIENTWLIMENGDARKMTEMDDEIQVLPT
ncbi:Xaa-Pro peptidase family protein [Desulfurispirillum indicum]|uniref:M24 family metallopeptidase n=1 Tax=Desulfurispirillum indicum TaxID=936456 RepID=UPI001CFA0565|nr:Xaa-Pro peptidase family protein [Desulfurispirillum indicum]UCZ57875.1 Xaa-Pro peptidase family protein [Desulfurispirillum indicum]